MLLKGNLITVRVQLDLWYNFIRRPLTTVSVTIFLYFNSEEATKKVAQCKKKSQKLNFFFCQIILLSSKTKFWTILFPYKLCDDEKRT